MRGVSLGRQMARATRYWCSWNGEYLQDKNILLLLVEELRVLEFVRRRCFYVFLILVENELWH